LGVREDLPELEGATIPFRADNKSKGYLSYLSQGQRALISGRLFRGENVFSWEEISSL
jgi:hypothetical protein